MARKRGGERQADETGASDQDVVLDSCDVMLPLPAGERVGVRGQCFTAHSVSTTIC
jgi:hypothetical protein